MSGADIDNVFVVIGQTGEYSDRSEWFVAAYRDNEVAKAHAFKAEEFARAVYAESEQADDPYEVRSNACNPYDTRMYMDYTGTSYYVAPVPLLAALPEVA